jgi:hypothetical protein
VVPTILLKVVGNPKRYNARMKKKTMLLLQMFLLYETMRPPRPTKTRLHHHK